MLFTFPIGLKWGITTCSLHNFQKDPIQISRFLTIVAHICYIFKPFQNNSSQKPCEEAYKITKTFQLENRTWKFQILSES